MPKYGFEIANVSLKNKLCDKRKQICEKNWKHCITEDKWDLKLSPRKKNRESAPSK